MAEKTSLRAAFDVGLEPFDLPIRRLVAPRIPTASAVAARSRSTSASTGLLSTTRELDLRRLPPRPADLDLGTTPAQSARRATGSARGRRSICCCRVVIDSSRACAASRAPSATDFGLGQLDPHAPEVGLGLGHARRSGRLALARVVEPAPHRLDDLRQLAILPGEEHLFPATHFVAELPVPPRLGRLALQRAALLLDLEDDVVDAREVLLRGLELQLGGPPPRLVLRDARGFLDEHAPVGRARAQDQPDLALLDDGVGLGAEPVSIRRSWMSRSRHD